MQTYRCPQQAISWPHVSSVVPVVMRMSEKSAKEKADELLMHLIVAIVSVTIVIALSLGWRGALVVFISVPVSFAPVR